ncbi:unnamed protein product [Mucor hiemalis]
MIICLKNSQFYINQGSISTRKVNGFNMTTIIPNQFHTDSSATTIEPLAIDVSNSPAFDADFNSLFQDQHLTFIHTEYFGIRGVSEQTMRAHPVQSSLLRLLESEEIKKDTFAEVNAPSTLKQIALQSYITNFKNMWSDKIMINKLLDKVLIVLLRLHLAPTRESRRREMMNSHLEKDKEEKRPTKNYSRNILRLEMKKPKRYEKKLSNASTTIEKERWLVVTEASRNRIMQLKEKLKKPRQSKGSSPLLGKLKGKFNEADNDISGRRIGQLKSAVKHLLFSKDSATKQDVEDEIYNVTRKEIDVCFLIMNTIKKFLPVKAKYHILAYQLPFCIFANDILEYCKYSKFCRKLCPSTSAANVNALQLDAVSLYQVLSTKAMKVNSTSSELTLYGYNNEVISSMDMARRNKDATFNAIFDMTLLQNFCSLKGLTFAQRVTLLPGLKTIRLMGTKTKSVTSNEHKDRSYMERILNHPKVVAEAQTPLIELKASMADCQKEVTILQSKLEKSLDLQKEQQSTQRLKDLRNEWCRTSDKLALYREITDAKRLRDETYQEINDIKDKIQKQKQTMYHKQMATRYYTKITKDSEDDTSSALSTETKTELKKDTRGLFKSEECLLKDPKQFTFCKTDNGLVNMTTAVPLSVERFRFHLKLHNYYSVLDKENASIQIDENESKNFLKIPKATIISASEVDFGCGHFRKRIKLQKSKKNTANGREIMDIEKKLSESSISTIVASVNQFKENLKVHKTYRAQLQQFYFSEKRVNESRHLQLQQHKFLHNLCRIERKKISISSGNTLKPYNFTVEF